MTFPILFYLMTFGKARTTKNESDQRELQCISTNMFQIFCDASDGRNFGKVQKHGVVIFHTTHKPVRIVIKNCYNETIR